MQPFPQPGSAGLFTDQELRNIANAEGYIYKERLMREVVELPTEERAAAEAAIDRAQQAKFLSDFNVWSGEEKQYPENLGSVPFTEHLRQLVPGEKINRIGWPAGKFASFGPDPFPQRSLPESSLNVQDFKQPEIDLWSKPEYWKNGVVLLQPEPGGGYGPYVEFEVVKSGGCGIVSTIAPAFGQPGGGTQFYGNLKSFLDSGIIKIIRIGPFG